MKKLGRRQDCLQLSRLSYNQPDSPICGIHCNLIRDSERGMRERHPVAQLPHMGCLVPAMGEGGNGEHNRRDFHAIVFLGTHCVNLWADTLFFLKHTSEGES